jgi:hypothetical protein
LGQKKVNTVVKKIVAVVVWRILSAFFDDVMIDEPRPNGFSSCLWCDLTFNICCSYSLALNMTLSILNLFQMMAPELGKLPLIRLLFLMLEMLPPTFFSPRQSFSQIY